MSTTYNIDRETASRLLDVSVRTVDRYIKHDKLSSIRSEGRVWLSKEEILDFIRKKQSRQESTVSTRQRQAVEPDIILVNADKLSTAELDKVDKASRQTSDNGFQSEEPGELISLRTQLAVKTQELEFAQERIRQLEEKVNEMVPLLELKEQRQLLAERTEQYERQIADKTEEIKRISAELTGAEKRHEDHTKQLMSLHTEEVETQHTLIKNLDQQLHEERVNKWIFSITLYVVVIAIVVFWTVIRFF